MNPKLPYAVPRKSILNNRLLRASIEGDSRELHRLLSGGGRTTIVDDDWRSLLSLASYHGHDDCVKVLLEYGAEVDSVNFEHYTPLAFAAGSGHSDCVELLIEAGADVNHHTADGSVLTHAADGNNIDCLRLLLNAGADPNATTCYGGTALSIVLENRLAAGAHLLLENGACFKGADDFAFDEMMRAVLGDDEECIQIALDCGGNPYYLGRKLDLKIFDALFEDDVDLLRDLISRGADVNVRDANGQTPLFHELQYSSLGDCLPLLLEAGADESIRDNDGLTAWDYSALCGYLHGSKLSPDEVKESIQKMRTGI